MGQELTLPIASTKKEPITFRRQTWYMEYHLHNIVNMYCAVCIPISCTASSKITKMTRIGDLFSIYWYTIPTRPRLV